jgi:hypothetical protein
MSQFLCKSYIVRMTFARKSYAKRAHDQIKLVIAKMQPKGVSHLFIFPTLQASSLL